MNLNDIQTEEMIVDFQESIYDASVCQAALARGIVVDKNGYNVEWRMQMNNKFVKTIREELTNRGVDVDGIRKVQYPETYNYDRKVKE